MQETHIKDFAKECMVTVKTVYNNKGKFGLTFNPHGGLTFVIIDKNAKLFKELKLKQAELLKRAL